MDPNAAVLAHLKHLRLRGLAEGTIMVRRNRLRALAAALPCPLLDAGPAELTEWRAGLTCAPFTASQYTSNISQFYDWAVSEGLISDNPAANLPRARRPRRLPRPITEADLQAALEAAPPRVRPWLVLAGWAGLRAKEIALLRRECVLEYAEHPVLIVAADATKGRTERIIPLSRFVLAELVPVLPARGWVFPRGDGKPGPNKPWMISRGANTCLHELGIAATLHQLRHRFGTMAYQRGGRDLRAVQELMGHADPMTTAGYAAYDEAAAAATVEAIPTPAAARSWAPLTTIPARPAGGPARQEPRRAANGAAAMA